MIGVGFDGRAGEGGELIRADPVGDGLGEQAGQGVVGIGVQGAFEGDGRERAVAPHVGRKRQQHRRFGQLGTGCDVVDEGDPQPFGGAGVGAHGGGERGVTDPVIAEGVQLTTEGLRTRFFGPYCLQAAIAAVHAESPSAGETDWSEIIGLYDVLARLEALVSRARPLVYERARRGVSFAEFATTGYWQRVRERPSLLLVAALLLFVPWVLAAVWAVRDPGAASGVVPGEYRSVTEPRERGGDLGRTTDEQAAFSSEIFTNNIRVTIVAFAGGIAAGIGTAALLVYQGVLFGAITGLSIWAGNGVPFFELVTAHGVLGELLAQID